MAKCSLKLAVGYRYLVAVRMR